MTGHHLILGKLTDFITGKTIEDTHDERYRQKIAKFLVNKRGYDKKDITSAFPLMVRAGDKKGIIPVDFIIKTDGKAAMVIKYGPGSLTTRHRPGLAIARLVGPFQVPVIVVTNGENADVLNGKNGKVMGSGFEAIPSKADLVKIMEKNEPETISPKQAEMESRIVYCYEIDGSCPCDTTVCRLTT